MGGSSQDEDMDLTPLELRQQVVNVELNFLPELPKSKYLKVYKQINERRLSKGAKTCSEIILLSYSMDASETRLLSTLWSIYSILKATLKAKHNVHIETYLKLCVFLKRTSEGYKSKKFKVFSSTNIEQFLNEAPDRSFLATKVLDATNLVLVFIGSQVVEEAAMRLPDDTSFLKTVANIQFSTIILFISLRLLPFELCGLVGAHKEHVQLLKIYYYYSYIALILSVPVEVLRPSDLDVPLGVIIFILDMALSIYMLIVVRSEIIRLNTDAKAISPENEEKKVKV